MIRELSIKSSERNEFIDVTSEVEKAVKDVKEGTVTLFVPHTTAAITIKENADPDVSTDVLNYMSKLIPETGNFSHSEGNSDSHIKSSLFGLSLTVIVKNGKLVLGTWQSIFFCEFDGPRSRKLLLHF